MHPPIAGPNVCDVDVVVADFASVGRDQPGDELQ